MAKSFKCIIAGSRSIKKYEYVEQAVKQSGWADKITEVVSGDAKGVDYNGSLWGKFHSIKVEHFPAKWKDLDVPNAVIKENEYGKYNARAGIDRNEKMGDYADALICIITNNSSGSTHMIEYMRKIGKPVYIMEV